MTKETKLLKFYKENNQLIQLKIGNNKVVGKIKELNWTNLVLNLENDDIMKIYFNDINAESILPASIETETKMRERKSIPQSVRKELWINHFGE